MIVFKGITSVDYAEDLLKYCAPLNVINYCRINYKLNHQNIGFQHFSAVIRWKNEA
jgi:hypothetical protein